MQQQDAHEFLNYLLNTVADLLAGNSQSMIGFLIFLSTLAQHPSGEPNPSTWIHSIFQGTLVNETRCLCCETVRSKEEDFLDLSLDIDQNTSLTHCLKYAVLPCLIPFFVVIFKNCLSTPWSTSSRTFSTYETLSAQYKYYCEVCCSKQEATKRLRVKQLPMILALHLKRFKFMEHLRRHTKLSHRVVFPWELKLFNTVSQHNVS